MITLCFERVTNFSAGKFNPVEILRACSWEWAGSNLSDILVVFLCLSRKVTGLRVKLGNSRLLTRCIYSALLRYLHVVSTPLYYANYTLSLLNFITLFTCRLVNLKYINLQR